MRRICWLLLPLISLLVLGVGLHGRPGEKVSAVESWEPDLLWVRLSAGAAEKELPRVRAVLEREGLTVATVVRAFPQVDPETALSRVYRLSFVEEGAAERALQPLNESGAVDYAERIPRAHSALVPNDPSYVWQTYLQDVGAEAAWDALGGDCTTTIAIVDDAVEVGHPDLAAAIFQNSGEVAQNGLDDDQNGRVDDVAGFDVAMGDPGVSPPESRFGHGTLVAGLAAASTHNGVGIAGIGRGCRLLPVKAATDTSPVVSRGYEGIVYAAQLGARVISCSWGTPQATLTGQAAVEYAQSRGAVIVAAAGNTSGSSPVYPASSPGVIAVAALDALHHKLPSSSYRADITLSAPGDALLTTSLNGGYAAVSGTSASAALVSGVVAMMASKHPGMPGEALRACLQSTAVNIDAQNPGYAGQLGAGRLDAAAAMACVTTALSEKPRALFSQDRAALVAGGAINFTDVSTYSPTGWVWAFPGGTPASFTGRSPPAIRYSNPGTFEVTLTVSNANGDSTQTRQGAVTVSANPDTCSSLNLPQPPGWNAASYTLGAGGTDGFINGTNAYLDKQKAMFFDVSSTSLDRLTRAYVAFQNAVGADTVAVPVQVYDGTSGAPGAMLGESVLTLGQIKADVGQGGYSVATFAPAVQLPGSRKFFVSVRLSNLSWNANPRQSLSIVSNSDGQTSPGAIWEQQQNNLWARYGDAGSFTLQASLYIHPFLTDAAPTAAALALSATQVCSGARVDFDGTGTTQPGDLQLELPGGSPSSLSNVLSGSALFLTPGNYLPTQWVQSACGEVASVTRSLEVLPSPTVEIVSSTRSLCAGETVTLTASGLDAYAWSPALELSATAGAVVSASPTVSRSYSVIGSAGPCQGSATIELEVNPVVLPSLAISVEGGVLTAGAGATLTATVQHPGAQPTYQWRKNGAPVGGNSPSHTEVGLVEGDVFTCHLTSSAPCATTATASSNALVVAAAPADAGSDPDAGTLADAGSELDAGSDVDGGQEPDGPQGCGCASSGGLSASWLLGFALLLAARRRSAQAPTA